MDSQLRTLANRFAREVSTEEIQQYAFVFPNRRAGIFFKKYLGEAYACPILAPSVLTINECFYSLCKLRLADPIDLLFRVYKAYLDIQGTHKVWETFDSFLFWGKFMLGDFSEIDNHLVSNVRELFTTIRDLKEIDQLYDYLSVNQKEAITEFWGEINEHQHQEEQIKERFIHIWETLWPIYEHLKESLHDNGLAYDGQIHREVIEHWDEIDTSLFKKHYVFIGFHTLTASEDALIQRMIKEGRGELIANSDWREEGAWPEITHIQISSTVGEAHEVYQILDTLYPNGGDFTQTALVLPDERMLLPVMHSIPTQIDKVNVTMGYPLSATPTYALLKLTESLRKRATNAGFYHKDVVALLNHRYISRLLGERGTEICQQIQEKNLIYWLPTENDDSNILPIIFDKESGVMDYLRSLLSILDETDSEEIYLVQTGLNRIEKAISQYTRQADNGEKPITIEEQTLFQLINLILGELSIPYSGEPLAGLQIMGVLETRALEFENVIITGFNDDIYPGNSRGNSFIPYILRKGFNLPTSERQDTIFAHNFYRLIRHAKHVWLITNSRADDTHSGEASRYLAQLIYEHEVPIKEVVVVPSSEITPSQPRIIEKTDAIKAQLSAYADSNGKRGFSPSALNNYLRCPLLFYWKSIAGIHESDEVKEELQERDLGTILHEVMEHLYQPYKGKTVQYEDISKMLEQKDELVIEQAKKHNIELSTLTQSVIQEYLKQLLNHDATLTPFEYIDSELPVSMPLTLHDGQEVRLHGFIDRIDKHGISTHLVDYKTGEAAKEYVSIESLFDGTLSTRNKYALQTILYAIMYKKHDTKATCIEPHLYAVRSKENSTLVHEKKKVDFILKDVEEEFLERLRTLIEEILSDKPFTPTSNERNCEKCAFASLCR